jgi:predicted phage tail protein
VVGALVVPTTQLPKLWLAGEKVSGRIAVPEASKTSGLTAVLSFTATDPVMVPLVEGVKVTVNVQEAPEARVVTQPDEL